MNLHDLPPEDFMPVQPLDEDSSFTYRRRQRVFPRDALAGEVEAGILRLANAKYTARGLNDEEKEEGEREEDKSRGGPAGEASDVEMRDSLEDDEDLQSATKTDTSASASEDDVKPKAKKKAKTKIQTSDSEADSASGSEDSEGRQRTPELRGVLAADDDVSSAILKPAVSDIVAKLEKTLTVLHNMMVSTVQTVDDEDDSEDETGVDESFPTRSRSRFSRSRSRSRRRAVKRPRSDSEFPATDPESEAFPFPSPQKKPRYASAEDEDEAEGIEEADAKDAEEEYEGEGDDEDEHPRSGPPPNDPPPAPETHNNPPERILRRRAVRLNRLAPRNWRAVLGAASLAGFPRVAILRATQRCVDLFGEGAEAHLLNDHSPKRDTRKAFVPGGGATSGVDEDGMAELGEVARMRLATRDASRVEEPESRLKSGSPSTAGRATRSGTRSQTRSRTPAPRQSHTPTGSRSRSRSRSATPHLACPYRSCPRSVEPFSRRGNLVRHIEVMHGGEGLGMDVDSEDEMEGGVHVDGFLRQVRVRRGWRGEDVREEERGKGLEKERGRGVERRGRGRRAKVGDEGFGGLDYGFRGMDDGLY